MDKEAITIEPIVIEQKSVLRQLMELCSYDFSPYDQADANEHGFFGYKYIDHYWTDVGRFPYFIKAQGKFAGFVLVGRYTPQQRTFPFWTINEFFIMKKYRRKGLGKYVARTIFDRYKGAWEVSQIYNNDVSRYFWEAVIAEYTQGKYDRQRGSKDGFERQFLYFENSGDEVLFTFLP